MDAQGCMRRLEEAGILAFATVDGDGSPQVRNISAIHYEPDAMYFFTARGKEFCRELMDDGRFQALGYTSRKEMIRISGRATPAEDQGRWMSVIFDEQPYLSNVYPGETRDIGIVFEVRSATLEYFNLGVRPIDRGTYSIGGAVTKDKGFVISDGCTGCGTCAKGCPQGAIVPGRPYRIDQRHCLHCGRCAENCPSMSIGRL